MQSAIQTDGTCRPAPINRDSKQLGLWGMGGIRIL